MRCTSAATVTAPNLLNLLLPSRATAAPGDCTITFGGSSTIPYIGFDLSGGANMAGSNVLVGQNGGRCKATQNLQIDHVISYALGGTNAASNLRVLCRTHNQLAAETVFGKERMRQFR